MVDSVDRTQQLTVLTPSDIAGHKDAQVTDARVPQVNDGATGLLQGEIAGINVSDPVQCLLRGGDVVAIGTEHHHWHFDAFEIKSAALAPQAPGQLIADEQVVDNHFDLFTVEQGRAAPPALEIQKPRRLAVHFTEQVIVLAPVSIGRVEAFEITDQPGAVETVIAQVAAQARHPAAAQQTAGVAHRIATVDAGPIRQWRAIDDDQPWQFRPCSRQPHQCPTGLAITDHHGFGAAVMSGADHFDKSCLGFNDVVEGLARAR